jgi:hypothetical protein
MPEIAALQQAATDKESKDAKSIQIKTSLTFTAVLKLMNDLEFKVGPACSIFSQDLTRSSTLRVNLVDLYPDLESP